MSLITPRTPPGTMELLPRRQIAFQRMLDTIRRGYERFGFLPVETPVFELTDVLLSKSGGETEKQVYFVQSTGALAQDRAPELALRFDLTVPLARYVAEHERDLAFPFRRFQIQRVYRGERAQKGRYREFYQCDIDVIGKDSLPMLYDAEIPAVIDTVFTELNVGAFTININNRKVLLGLLEALGVEQAERRGAALREIDKLDKIGPDRVRQNLTGGELALPDDVAARILALLATPGSPAEVVAALGRAGIDGDTFRQGVAELTTVVEGLRSFGVPESRFRVNLAIARGLDYYTGTVYETFLTDHPGFGSVCSGGRYENLASQYTKSRLPGVGISIGATRLFSALSDAGLIADGRGVVDVLVTQMDAELAGEYLALASALRAAGVNTEIFLEPAKVARQLKHADRIGARFAVLMGSDERARGSVLLKDMVTGGQTDVPRDALVAEVAARLRG
jgi:histidyl-tRNA synthetase